MSSSKRHQFIILDMLDNQLDVSAILALALSSCVNFRWSERELRTGPRARPLDRSALGSTSRSAPTSPAASWLCVSCPFSRNYRSTTAIVSKKTSSENVLTIQFHCTREIYRAVLHNRPCSDSAGRCMPGARSRCQTQGGLVVIADRLTFRTRLLISQGP